MSVPTRRAEGAEARKAHQRAGSGLKLALAFFGTVGTLAAAMPAVARERPPMVRIPEGWLQGTRADGLDRFLGVPYAAPPVGALRWEPPEPAASWSGVRSAETLPPRCAQIGGDGEEDCLYLNVFRPTRQRRHGRLPVLVYIHGGSLKVGSAFDNDPSRIAESTDTVVVMINYRLGQFGFLAHPALSAESGDGTSGEYGLMDQQAALQWVNQRIAAFGGDPHNVTIAGGSAGGWSVCAHLVSEPVAGLFSGAVIQSADCLSRPLPEAEALGVEFGNVLGCSDSTSSDCLRSKTTEEILASDSWAFASLPVAGGRLLPEAPDVAIRAGRFRRVPVLFGGTRNELRQALTGLYPMTEETYVGLVNELFADLAPTVLDAYPSANFGGDPFDAFAELLNDSGVLGAGACISRRLAQTFADYVPTFVYEFDDPDAPVPTWVNLPEGMKLGSSHGSDEVYWFDRPFDTVEPLNPSQRFLAQQMVEYLGAFAERRNPNLWFQPYWPRYDDRDEAVLRFRPNAVRVRLDFAQEHRCEFWAELGF
ncbi:MAG: carboxylesterase/lipase family protein [Myxococcota bacterium]